MALGRLWAGRIFGTNTGNVFAKLEGHDDSLTGTLHVNEPGVGVAVYGVQGTFDGHQLTLSGNPAEQIEGVVLGQLAVNASLTAKGELRGEWATSAGSAGTFVLYPHDQAYDAEEADPRADQLHTARHQFGAVEVDRRQITAIADAIQSDFKNDVVVTVVTDTEHSHFLPNFKVKNFTAERASIVKLFVQEPEGNGVNRIAQVEFGPQLNLAMTQGTDEAWVLGMLEKVKHTIRPFERTYTTNFKKWGFGINQLLLVSAIVYLPDLRDLLQRAVFMLAVLAITYCVSWLHTRYLPLAAIYMHEKSKGVFSRVGPSVISWLIAASASLAAALLAAYLQGYLHPPGGSTL